MLRNGTVGYKVPQFKKVVGVGHSYGSNLLAGVAATAPDAFDVSVLTGFTGNATNGSSSPYSFNPALEVC
jgi:hypothetical protein